MKPSEIPWPKSVPKHFCPRLKTTVLSSKRLSTSHMQLPVLVNVSTSDSNAPCGRKGHHQTLVSQTHVRKEYRFAMLSFC